MSVITGSFWGRRIIAFIIDYIILPYLVARIIFSPFQTQQYYTNVGSNMIYSLMSMFIAGLPIFLYFVFCDSIFGYTVGKRIFGLKVVQTNGAKASFIQTIIRNISKIFLLALVLDFIMGFFFASQSGQKFSDHIARTQIIRFT